MNTIVKAYLLVRTLVLGVRESAEAKYARLRVRAEAGDGSAGWVLILIGVIAIAAIVIGAVTAYVQTQTSKLK